MVTLTLPKAQAGNKNQGNLEADCFVVESFNLTAPGHMRMGFGDSDKADVQHQIVVTGISSGNSITIVAFYMFRYQMDSLDNITARF